MLLLGLCVVGIVYGRIQSIRRDAHAFDPLAKVAHTLVDPIARVSGATADGVDDFAYGLLNARRLRAENRRMKDLLTAAQLYQVDTDQLTQEIERLRRLQNLPDRGKTRLVTDILGFSPYENRITLGAGSAEGVGVGMPIECDLGLVGTVQIVDSHRCQAQLLSSPGLTLGAVDVDHNPPPEGLINGESPSKLSLIFVDPEATVSVGDHIETSGHSDRIPRGILIGTVIAVDYNPEFGMRRATVFPSVQIGKIREVAILK